MAFVYAAARTPFGRFNAALADVRPDDLAATAIAIGHPLGASGARILGTLAKVLVARRARYGVAAIRIGVGQALAVVLENVTGGAA
ncbi:hypothetical protein [Dactylosporangium salmoneum]|uniref:acetyl-CoA C-acetyltransferase n=1 Tax=Dactylosporangium salmoneum TaxID=53361 RepID=A0ABN3G6E4_9ACTN